MLRLARTAHATCWRQAGTSGEHLQLCIGIGLPARRTASLFLLHRTLYAHEILAPVLRCAARLSVLADFCPLRAGTIQHHGHCRRSWTTAAPACRLCAAISAISPASPECALLHHLHPSRRIAIDVTSVPNVGHFKLRSGLAGCALPVNVQRPVRRLIKAQACQRYTC